MEGRDGGVGACDAVSLPASACRAASPRAHERDGGRGGRVRAQDGNPQASSCTTPAKTERGKREEAPCEGCAKFFVAALPSFLQTGAAFVMDSQHQQ